MTWEQLVELEPGLQRLLDAIKAIGCRPSKVNRGWYGRGSTDGEWIRGFKHEMSDLVGHQSVNADDPVLGSSEAYSLAYSVLYGALGEWKDEQALNDGKAQGLVGQYFHSIANGKIEWQGRVISNPELGWYLVETFEGAMGEPSLRRLVRIEDMAGWLFYADAEWMKFSFEYGPAEFYRVDR